MISAVLRVSFIFAVLSVAVAFAAYPTTRCNGCKPLQGVVGDSENAYVEV